MPSSGTTENANGDYLQDEPSLVLRSLCTIIKCQAPYTLPFESLRSIRLKKLIHTFI